MTPLFWLSVLAFLTSFDEVTVVVNNPGGAGTLSGGQAVQPAAVGLTAEGTLDWAHWGLGGTGNYNTFNRKAGVSPPGITTITNIGAGGNRDAYSPVPPPVTYSWTDGSPTASANTTSGIYATAVGNGFQFTAPADTAQRMVANAVELVPASEPFLLDFATSRVAQGKMRVARGGTRDAGQHRRRARQPCQPDRRPLDRRRRHGGAHRRPRRPGRWDVRGSAYWVPRS